MFAPAFKLSGPPWRAQVFVGVPGGAAGTVGQLKSQGGGKANLRNPLHFSKKFSTIIAFSFFKMKIHYFS